MKIKDIRGYEGEYTIREDGQVFSIKSNQFIKQRLNKRYLEVVLCKKRQAEAFLCSSISCFSFYWPYT